MTFSARSAAVSAMMKLMRAALQDERFRDERALASPDVTHLVILGSMASILEAPCRGRCVCVVVIARHVVSVW